MKSVTIVVPEDFSVPSLFTSSPDDNATILDATARIASVGSKEAASLHSRMLEIIESNAKLASRVNELELQMKSLLDNVVSKDVVRTEVQRVQDITEQLQETRNSLQRICDTTYDPDATQRLAKRQCPEPTQSHVVPVQLVRGANGKFKCSYPGCTYESNYKQSIKQHRADRHDIQVKWYACDQPGCFYRAKQKGNLKNHLKNRHYNIFCQRKKIQEEKVRTALLTSQWKEWPAGDTLPPPGHFKREHQIDFRCADASVDKKYCRIDFVLSYANGAYVFLEVDEHQHRFGYVERDGAAISCDAKRMANVFTSLTVEFRNADPPPIYWLRYNPHEFQVDGVTQTLLTPEREVRLCAFLQRLNPSTGIGYAFYDSDDSGLELLEAEEFPATLSEIVENLGALDDFNAT